jgi:hypothetical protein
LVTLGSGFELVLKLTLVLKLISVWFLLRDNLERLPYFPSPVRDHSPEKLHTRVDQLVISASTLELLRGLIENR